MLDTGKQLEISVGGDVIAMPAMKKAYDRDAVIFGLINNTGGTQESYIKVNNNKPPLSFGKYKVKTVAYENGELTDIYDMII